MLGKLLKHELRATSRYLLPIFAILALFTVLARIVLGLDIFNGVLSFIPGFIMVGYVLSMVAIVVVTIVVLVMRFYKNLTSDEGYLMFTLPVKPRQLINSKLIIALFWSILSFIGVLLSIFVVVLTEADMETVKLGFKLVWEQINSEFKNYTTLFVVELILLIILSGINKILHVYASIALGQLLNGRRLIGSFGAYIGITVAIQFIVTAVLLIFGLTFNADLAISTIATVLFPTVIISLIVLNLVFYFITDYLFTKKLNLE